MADKKESNVRVAIRCRPLNEREKKSNRAAIVQCKVNANQVCVRKKTYTFDHVFGQYTTQEELFQSIIQPVVVESLNGYNCTVFAYGQTGTGKTHTIQGSLDPSDEVAGIIPRSIAYIFDYLNKNHQDFSVRVSYLQLYNEELSDLLCDKNSGKKLRLMEDAKKSGVYCQNLQEIPAATANDVFQLLEKGVKNRTTAETMLNENSSRSHSIFTIRLHTKESTPGGEDLVKTGTLNLVDLAGSECIGRSGAKNVRAREAGNINQSLLTLGRVITALVDNHPHVPYRDSKLTRLLQESLGGRAKTTIVATLAPAADCVDETMSTLDYAHRAKSIKNKPEVNQRTSKHEMLKDYSNEIEALRDALQSARDKDGVYLAPAKFAEMQEQLAGQKHQIEELEILMEKHAQEKESMEAVAVEQKEALEDTQLQLTNTSNELQLAEKAQRRLEIKLAESAHFAKIAQQNLYSYANNEEQLLQAAKSAELAYNKIVGENKVLLEAIERKERILKNNKAKTQQMAVKSASMSDETIQLIKSQVHDMNNASTSITQVLQSMGSTHHKHLTKANQSIADVANQVDNFVATMQQHHATAESSMDEHHSDIGAWSKSVLESLTASSIQLRKQVQKLVSETATHLSTSDEKLQDNLRCIIMSEKGLQDNFKEIAECTQNQLNAFAELLNNNTEHELHLLKEHVSMVSSFQNNTTSFVNSSSHELTHLIENAIKQFATSLTSTISNGITPITQQADTILEHIVSTNMTNRDQLTKNSTEIASMCTYGQNTASEIEAMVENLSTSTATTTRDLVNNMETQKQTSFQSIDASEKHRELEIGNVIQLHNQHYSTCAAAQKAMQAFNSTLQQHTLASLNSFHTIQEAALRDLSNTTKNATQQLESLATSCKSTSTQVHDSVQATSTSIADHVHQQQDDIGTGHTPAKANVASFPVFKAAENIAELPNDPLQETPLKKVDSNIMKRSLEESFHRNSGLLPPKKYLKS